MNSEKIIARFIGALFLIAMFSSLVGGGLIEDVLSKVNFLDTIYQSATQLNAGVILEIVNAISVIGIAILFYPIIKIKNESLAIGYVCFRILESIFCLAAAVIPLAIIKLNSDAEMLIIIRNTIASTLIPLGFSLGALILYFFLYTTKLLPRFISIWGFIAVILIMILNIFKFDMSIGMFLALPIILNEIVMGIWLITKGFNRSDN
ncbi:MAG: DUF4386 domain-containing protein [Ignavibacteriae bacterium]|nr:DUF4386 domain-containing protein [Ignavibacteriota bacterium]